MQDARLTYSSVRCPSAGKGEYTGAFSLFKYKSNVAMTLSRLILDIADAISFAEQDCELQLTSPKIRQSILTDRSVGILQTV
jgi:hypothetical protein